MGEGIDIQIRFEIWYRNRINSKQWVEPNPNDSMLFLQEEVGEVQHVFNRLHLKQYVRNHPIVMSDQVLRQHLRKELCDVVCMVMTLARTMHLDMDSALEMYLKEERT